MCPPLQQLQEMIGQKSYCTMEPKDTENSPKNNLLRNIVTVIFIGAESSSALGKNFAPELAIDGKIVKSFTRFFHSEKESDPWLRLTLENPTPIKTIKVHNRFDCCQERLKGAIVIVKDVWGMNTSCKVKYEKKTKSLFSCGRVDEGKQIIISLNGTDRLLQVNEVEVNRATAIYGMATCQ